MTSCPRLAMIERVGGDFSEQGKEAIMDWLRRFFGGRGQGQSSEKSSSTEMRAKAPKLENGKEVQAPLRCPAQIGKTDESNYLKVAPAAASRRDRTRRAIPESLAASSRV
jgi:hypothetical protein